MGDEMGDDVTRRRFVQAAIAAGILPVADGVRAETVVEEPDEPPEAVANGFDVESAYASTATAIREEPFAVFGNVTQFEDPDATELVVSMSEIAVGDGNTARLVSGTDSERDVAGRPGNAESVYDRFYHDGTVVRRRVRDGVSYDREEASYQDFADRVERRLRWYRGPGEDFEFGDPEWDPALGAYVVGGVGLQDDRNELRRCVLHVDPDGVVTYIAAELVTDRGQVVRTEVAGTTSNAVDIGTPDWAAGPESAFPNGALVVDPVDDVQLDDRIELPVTVYGFAGDETDVRVDLESEDGTISASTTVTPGARDPGEYTFEIDADDVGSGEFEFTVLVRDLRETVSVTVTDAATGESGSPSGENGTNAGESETTTGESETITGGSATTTGENGTATGASGTTTDGTEPTDGESGAIGLETQELVAVGAGGGGLAALLGAYAVFGRSDDESDADEAATGPSPDALRERAESAASSAEQARADGDYETAVERYTDALETYRTARQRMDADERDDSIATAIESVRRERDHVQDLRDARATLRDTLSAAERSFQSAIAAHARDEGVPARVRYREARNALETAREQLEATDHDLLSTPITVSVDVESWSPPGSIADLPAIDGETADRLAEAGLETIDDLRTSDDALADLDADSAIDADAVALLRALSLWHGDDEFTIAEPGTIERRYERATAGFDAVR